MNTHRLSVLTGFDSVVWVGEFRSHSEAFYFADATFSRFSHTFEIEEI